jgi:hypothetical protein
MRIRIGNRAAAWWLTGLLLLTLAAGGCAVKFVSDYDPVFDKQLAGFQKQVFSFMTDMSLARGKPAGLYKNNLDFYQKTVPVQIEILLFRARLQDNNQETITMIEKLDQNFKIMAKLHKLHGYLTAGDLKMVSSGINTSFRALMLFEMDKKRGRGIGK